MKKPTKAYDDLHAEVRRFIRVFQENKGVKPTYIYLTQKQVDILKAHLFAGPHEVSHRAPDAPLEFDGIPVKVVK